MASRNQSNNEKTLKTTLLTMQNDFWTIDNVSMYCNYLNRAIMPDGFILDEYRDYFENFLVEVNVSEEYYYSPSLFAEVQYGTPDLDFLIMYFAKISSLFDFNQPRIKMLPISSLTDLNKLIVQNKLNIRQSKIDPKTYNRLAKINIPERGFIETKNLNIITTKSNIVVIKKASENTSTQNATEIDNSKLEIYTQGETVDIPDSELIPDSPQPTTIISREPAEEGRSTSGESKLINSFPFDGMSRTVIY
jgi:hypothetical protein